MSLPFTFTSFSLLTAICNMLWAVPRSEVKIFAITFASLRRKVPIPDGISYTGRPSLCILGISVKEQN